MCCLTTFCLYFSMHIKKSVYIVRVSAHFRTDFTIFINTTFLLFLVGLFAWSKTYSHKTLKNWNCFPAQFLIGLGRTAISFLR